MVTDAPKRSKQKRSKKQIERVKKDGVRIAAIVGMIFTFSSIKWKVQSQTLQSVWYVVKLGTNGLICECPANAGGKKICKHSFAIHKLIEKEWWHRARKKIRIVRYGVRCIVIKKMNRMLCDWITVYI